MNPTHPARSSGDDAIRRAEEPAANGSGNDPVSGDAPGPRRRRHEAQVDLSQFIPGIYNYCDRWCDRCPLTAKCYLYWQERQREAEHRAAGRDPEDWVVVLEDMKEQLEHAMELLKEAAAEHGMNLEDLPEVPSAPPDPGDHPLQERAQAYCRAAQEFLKELRRPIMAERERLEEQARVLGPEQAARATRELLDAYEVVSWYHTLIPAKTQRALCSKMEAERQEDAEGREMEMRDAWGSAKVVHESLTRSMTALQRVFDWDRSLEDQVIPLLADLDWMRKQIQENFPGFQSFRRPGLDPE